MICSLTSECCYDGGRVLSENNAAGGKQRENVYGNYLDEVLIKKENSAEIYYAGKGDILI